MSGIDHPGHENSPDAADFLENDAAEYLLSKKSDHLD